jgi:hypothetical protein
MACFVEGLSTEAKKMGETMARTRICMQPMRQLVL